MSEKFGIAVDIGTTTIAMQLISLKWKNLVEKYESRYLQFKEIYPACNPIFDIIK